MLCYARTGPGRAVLFYGRQSLGKGLSLGKSRDTAFMLTGAGTLVGKPAYLAADPLTIQAVWQEIAWVITECQIKVRGVGNPHVNPSTPQPFRLNHLGDSPWKDTPRDANSDHQLSPHQPPRGQNCNQCRRDQGLLPPQSPSRSLDCGFESDRNSVSTASLMSSLSYGSEGSLHPWWGRQHGKTRSHMKINIPIFKMRTQRMLWPTRVGGGIWWYTIMQDAEIVPSSHMPSSPYRVILEN